MTRTGPGSSCIPGPRPGWPPSPPEPPRARGRQAARSAAIVYLPLHRTRPLTVTGQTLTFGFRAASITGEAEAGALAGLADLDLIQARRHAAVLTGCMLAGDTRRPADGSPGPRCAAWPPSRQEWAAAARAARGRAAMFDCPADLPGQPVPGRRLPAGLPDRQTRLPAGRAG